MFYKQLFYYDFYQNNLFGIVFGFKVALSNFNEINQSKKANSLEFTIMPLPMGHIAIGLATYELSTKNIVNTNSLNLIIFLTILANIPDFDVIVGLLIKWNGNAFHRGPTHSLLFALITGFLASRAWKLSSQIPRIKFGVCFSIILSHVLADLLFTSSPVSFFWPFEVSWSTGHSGWANVLNTIFFQGFQDAGIIVASAFSIILIRFIKTHRQTLIDFKISQKPLTKQPSLIEKR